MTEQLALIISAAVVFLVLARMIGMTAATVAAAVFTTCYFPVVALGEKDTKFSVGIANGFPEWRTYTLLFIFSGVLLILQHPISRINVAHLLFVGWLVYGVRIIWADTPIVYAGALQLVIGILAWSVGASLAQMDTSVHFEHLMVIILAGTAVFEAVVCLLQIAGVPINPISATQLGILGDRVTGTANHPNTLGKLMFSILLLLLPLTGSPVRKISRLALLGSAALFVPFGLAEGRANLAALVSTLLIWVALTPNSRVSSHRLALSSATIIAIAATWASVIARFEQDPKGGARGRLLEIASETVPGKLWEGVGPNSYVTEIARYHGSYIPVHNSFILLAAEAGLVGAVLYLTPVVVAVVRAVTDARKNPYSRALVATMPGWFAIAWTGWGILGNSVLPLFMCAIAYTATRSKYFSADKEESQDQKDSKCNRKPRPEADFAVSQ